MFQRTLTSSGARTFLLQRGNGFACRLDLDPTKLAFVHKTGASTKLARRRLPPRTATGGPLFRTAASKLKATLRKLAERTVAGLMRALEACADVFK